MFVVCLFVSFQNVKEGMLMLGCVKEVTDFEVTLGLPCGLQGFLSIRNISDSYTKLLSEQLDSADVEVCSRRDLNTQLKLLYHRVITG